MDLELFRLCRDRLSPYQHLVYQHLLLSYTGQAYEVIVDQMADELRITHRIVSSALNELHKRKFIACTRSPRFVQIEWVRRSAREKYPEWEIHQKREAVSIRLAHPEYGVVRIPPGQVNQFAKQRGIDNRRIYRLINGQEKTVKGWKLVQAG